jgi:hypothetical protein
MSSRASKKRRTEVSVRFGRYIIICVYIPCSRAKHAFFKGLLRYLEFFEAHGYRRTFMFWNPFQTKGLNIEVIWTKNESFKSFRASGSSFGILPVRAQKKQQKNIKKRF